MPILGISGIGSRAYGLMPLGRKSLQFIGETSLSTTSSNPTISLTNLTGGLGASPSTGDLVLVFQSIATQGANLSMTIPGYTTLVDSYSSGSYSLNLGISYRFMQSSPDTFVSLTPIPSGGSSAIVVSVWRNVDNVNGVLSQDFSPSVSPTTGTILPTFPAITTSTNGSLVLAVTAGSTNLGTPSYVSGGTGSSRITSVAANNSQDAILGVSWVPMTIAGSLSSRSSFGSFASTENSSFSSIYTDIALRPSF